MKHADDAFCGSSKFTFPKVPPTETTERLQKNKDSIKTEFQQQDYLPSQNLFVYVWHYITFPTHSHIFPSLALQCVYSLKQYSAAKVLLTDWKIDLLSPTCGLKSVWYDQVTI